MKNASELPQRRRLSEKRHTNPILYSLGRKLSNSEERNSFLVGNTPTKSIFVNFVLGFLSGEKRKSLRSKSYNRLSSNPASIMNNASETYIQPKSLVAQSPKDQQNLRKKEANKTCIGFPSLRQNNSLNTFLVKEKFRLEATQSERTLLLKEFSSNKILKFTKLPVPKEKAENIKKKKIKNKNKNKLEKNAKIRKPK